MLMQSGQARLHAVVGSNSTTSGAWLPWFQSVVLTASTTNRCLSLETTSRPEYFNASFMGSFPDGVFRLERGLWALGMWWGPQ